MREENPTEWFAEQERKKRVRKEIDKNYYRKKKETKYIEEKTLGWSELTPQQKKVSIKRYLRRWPDMNIERRTNIIETYSKTWSDLTPEEQKYRIITGSAFHFKL